MMTFYETFFIVAASLMRKKLTAGGCCYISTVVLDLAYRLFFHRWAQIANPLISEANFFTSGLAVQLTFGNVSGLVIEANFFSQSANPLE